jgi:hypothetical protein
MALADIRHEVILALAITLEGEREMRGVRERGADDEKVAAAGELDYLARREAVLRRRLVEIDRRVFQRRTLFSWVRQEWFGLMLNLESWIAHG